VEKIIKERLREVMEKKRAEQERIMKLRNADPNDVEAQKMIEEEIRKSMIEQNYMKAMDQAPELFGHITMLYIDVKVNGHPVQAFVDSGAQSTIISKDCAQACNIMHLLDTRFAGMAVGVGSSRILGRVHLAPLMLETGQQIECSFTVLEDNKVDLLFGLDNLKRH
jgi:DNA damage-inducible protein 1